MHTLLAIVAAFLPAQWDFNNDSQLNALDWDSYLSVYSEGPCLPPGTTCDPLLTIGADGSPFDPAALDLAFATIHGIPDGSTGWYPISIPADYPAVYISGSPSASDLPGSGSSLANPLRTPTVASIYSVIGWPSDSDIREDNVRLPSVLYFERGYTYPRLSLEFGGSPSRPVILASYGSLSEPPPILRGLRLAAGCRGHVHIHDLTLAAPPEGDAATGLDFLGGQSSILVSGVQVTGFRNNISAASLTDATFHRITVLDSWAPIIDGVSTGHSQGVGVPSSTNVTFIDSAFDGNGWALKPTHNTQFNHTFYVLPTSTNISVISSLISRSSNTGLQIRGLSCHVRSTYFYQNPASLTFGHDETPPHLAPSGTASFNTIISPPRTLGWHAGSALGLNVSNGVTISGTRIISLPSDPTPRIRVESWPPTYPTHLSSFFTVIGTTHYGHAPTLDAYRPLLPTERILPSTHDNSLSPLATIPWSSHLSAIRARHKHSWHPTLPSPSRGD